MGDIEDNATTPLWGPEYTAMEQPRPPRERRIGQLERPASSAVPPFDFVGLLRRARRNAGLSQREMAEAIGASKATIARAERDGGTVSLAVLLAVLAVGGIELVAIDREGEVFTMRPDALRDRAHRKLPAHLDAWVPSSSEYVQEHWRGSERRNAPIRWKFRSRYTFGADLPLYHPGPEDVQIARRRDEENRPIPPFRLHPRPEPPPLPECSCSDECVELGMPCPPACPCQCEGPGLTAS